MRHLNQLAQSCDHFCVRVGGAGSFDTVSPRHQHDGQASGFGSGHIDRRVATIKRGFAPAVYAFERKDRSVRRGFSRAIRCAANDTGEVFADPKVAQNFVAQMLRLVGTDRQADASLRKRGEGIGDTWKSKIGRGRDMCVPRPEFCEINGRVRCVLAHDGRNHRFAADRIHGSDQVSISACLYPTVSEHFIDYLPRQAGAVD